MIPVKSKKDIEIMSEGGKITARVLKQVLDAIKPGVNLLKLDKLAEELILKAGAVPSFKTVKNYNFSTCININEGVVHGVPKKDITVNAGDLVSVDLGVFYKGFHTDSSWSIIADGQNGQSVGFKELQKVRFLQIGEKALSAAIEQCRVGNTIGDVGFAIQTTVEEAGYSVVRDLIGHGIGRKLHESPQVPGFGKKGTGLKLLEGIVLAVEVIYARGSYKVENLKDGWTVETKDKSLAGLFEHTVAITTGNPLVLTV